MTVALDPALVSDLAAQVSGPVLGPEDAGYDAARSVHNGLIDRRPAVIVRCRNASDVPRHWRWRAGKGSKSRCAAAGTTSPDGQSRMKV